MGASCAKLWKVNHETKIMIYGAANAGKASVEQTFAGDPAEQQTEGGMKMFVLYHIVSTGPECYESIRNKCMGRPRFKIREDVVFVVIAIGDYDVDTTEGKNSVLAGIDILNTVMLDGGHATQSIVVYLNKFDLFQRKVAATTAEALRALPSFQPGDEGLTDFAGEDGDVEAAYAYLEQRVRAKHSKTASHLGAFDVVRCTATDEGAMRRDSQNALREWDPADLARMRSQSKSDIVKSPLQTGAPPPAPPAEEKSEEKKRASVFDFGSAYGVRDEF